MDNTNFVDIAERGLFRLCKQTLPLEPPSMWNRFFEKTRVEKHVIFDRCSFIGETHLLSLSRQMFTDCTFGPESLTLMTIVPTLSFYNCIFCDGAVFKTCDFGTLSFSQCKIGNNVTFRCRDMNISVCRYDRRDVLGWVPPYKCLYLFDKPSAHGQRELGVASIPIDGHVVYSNDQCWYEQASMDILVSALYRNPMLGVRWLGLGLQNEHIEFLRNYPRRMTDSTIVVILWARMRSAKSAIRRIPPELIRKCYEFLKQ